MYYPKSPFLRNNPLAESQLLKRNCPNFDGLMQWLCQTPTVTTYRVNLLRTSVAAFKERLHEMLNEKYPNNPPTIFEIPAIPEVVCISKTYGPTPLPNKMLKEVIVDSCCGAALLRGAHIYAPGVLAMETGTKQQEEVNVFADLAGKCKKGTNTRYESPGKVFVGAGVVHMQRHQLYTPNTNVGSPSGIAVEMKTTVSGVPTLGDLSSSDVLLQNLPSIVCVRVLDPQQGDCVLDMCAAPGNKTTHIAEMLQDCGTLMALDKTEKKVNALQKKIDNNKLASVKAFAYDSTKAYSNLVTGSDSWQPPFAANTFDRILLDAPCSALGNRPVLRSSITPNMLKSFPHVQRKLFENAVELLKPQGTLVYSTCTVTVEENECMVAWALKTFPQLSLSEATPKLGGPGLTGVGLNDDERLLVQRFGPTNLDGDIDTVGFFIAKFVKN